MEVSLRSCYAPTRQRSLPPVELSIRSFEQLLRREPIFRIDADPDTYADSRSYLVLPNMPFDAIRDLLRHARVGID
jgi:hypothetical protein